jgi:predicted Fe-Mo cluster-binding NifX family protein
MKLAIPINEKSTDSTISQSFGRALYFVIFNAETKENLFIENNATSLQGGAGIKAAQTLVDLGVDTLIALSCGENAERVLNKSEVLIYRSIIGSAKENIEAYLNNKLTLLKDFHPGFHHHGK